MALILFKIFFMYSVCGIFWGTLAGLYLYFFEKIEFSDGWRCAVLAGVAWPIFMIVIIGFAWMDWVWRRFERRD